MVEYQFVDLKKVLDTLDRHDMHVHDLHRGDPIGKFILPNDTHYIMQGAEVVHVGNLKTVNHFALRLSKEV
jgi:hypothetical protein